MKLSEAIRLGSMLNPQGFINQCDGTPEGRRAAIDGETTRALVAAHRAIGDTSGSWTIGWPWIAAHGISVCPQCGQQSEYGVFITIIHLNDFHRWTREQIADWVETIERAQEQPSEPVPVAETVTP